MPTFPYASQTLSRQTALQICRGETRGALDESATNRIGAARSIVEDMADGQAPVYGINTGFGPLCDVQITPEETNLLQYNLLVSHAVGVGELIKPELAKLMMVCKLQALCQGYSGVRLELIERIRYFVDHDLIPAVPAQGSVGASGDLAPLAHLFLPLIGLGEFWDGFLPPAPASRVLAQHNLEPLQLQAKEGLGLINGTQFILAHALSGLDRLQYLLDLADLAGAMSLEGYQGSAAPFRPELHELRPFEGTKKVAARIRFFLDGSENIKSHAACSRVQDPYSLRCMPQVHGASRNAAEHLEQLAAIELNSVTDNPIILGPGDSVSGGNFHGQPLAMALDYATLAAAELGNISDRRCYLLLEGKFGLPRLLTDGGGLNSGFMIPQYTTAALVTENKSLCWPPSADSVPTSLGQEDHVSMGSISGRKFNRVITNLEKILAIELMYAAQAMEYRRPLRYSDSVEAAFALIRSKVDKLVDDRPLKADIDAMVELVRTRAFNTTV